jgi:hypothetical protein
MGTIRTGAGAVGQVGEPLIEAHALSLVVQLISASGGRR